MTVKKFLGGYNIGRSAITRAIVVDAYGLEYSYSKRELMNDAYGIRGTWKITTFTITEDAIIIYTEGVME